MTTTGRDQTFHDIAAENLIRISEKMAEADNRLEQICATSKDGITDVIYSFDDGTGLTNYRMTVPDDQIVPSITGSFWPAFIYENEIHDLFGIQFTGLKLDYKGNFYRTSMKTPWKTERKEVR